MFDRYVGIPWIEHGRARDGADCYGLLWLIYRVELMVALPVYTDRYASTEDRKSLADLIGGELKQTWCQVLPGAERVLDLVLMREGRELSHIGVVVEPGRLIHVERGGSSVIEPYRSGVLKHRVIGFYRYFERT